MNTTNKVYSLNSHFRARSKGLMLMVLLYRMQLSYTHMHCILRLTLFYIISLDCLSDIVLSVDHLILYNVALITIMISFIL